MDVRKTCLLSYSLLFSFLLTTSCASKKEPADIFSGPPSESSSSSCQDRAIKNRFIIKWKDQTHSVIESTDKETFFKDFVQPQIDHIERAEYDYRVSIHDFQENTTFSLSSETSSSPYHLNIVEASYAWEQSVQGKGVLIAVIDSGVDTQHPQLKDRIYKNLREIPNNHRDDDGNGLVDDYQGFDFVQKTGGTKDYSNHGTHVSGIIAAGSSQNNTVVGIAPKSQILPLSFIGADGSGQLGDAIRAIQYAASQGAQIINASWGGPNCSTALKEVIENLKNQNILFVTAAGNNGYDLDQFPAFPAAFTLDSQITVGASNEQDLLASYSNYSHNRVQLIAPGSRILSTIPSGQTASLSGTSMAAPIVSGAAALLWSRFPSAHASQIKSALLKSSESTRPSLTVDYGRLNIKKALLALEAAMR